MKLLSAFVITVLASAFFIPLALGKDVPLHNTIPDLKNAPVQIRCARSTPAEIHVRVYINKDGGWRVNIFGRDKRDLSLSVLPADKSTEASHFFFVNGAWKLSKNTTTEELIKLPLGDLNYSVEEFAFLRECTQELIPK